MNFTWNARLHSALSFIALRGISATLTITDSRGAKFKFHIQQHKRKLQCSDEVSSQKSMLVLLCQHNSMLRAELESKPLLPSPPKRHLFYRDVQKDMLEKRWCHGSVDNVSVYGTSAEVCTQALTGEHTGTGGCGFDGYCYTKLGLCAPFCKSLLLNKKTDSMRNC